MLNEYSLNPDLGLKTPDDNKIILNKGVST